VERSWHLAALADALAATRGGGGVLVFLGGEAGGGKTALVRHFCRTAAAGGRVLWGACDPLFTPRPLGPFLDIAQDLGGEPRDLVAAGAKPYQVAAALAREVQTRPGTIVVLEDLHWADEATLDVLSLLGRRIGSVPALVIATYRDDELDRAHPLRRLLGELRGAGSVRRLTAPPLSVAAVRALAEPYRLDGTALHRATAGNPFFVTEVLASPGGGIPPTVRDAVLARVARLDAVATAVIEAVSIAVPQAELWLLDTLAPDAADGLERCLGAGILETAQAGVVFRHELARIAVEGMLPPHRRVDLHRRALRALSEPPYGAPDLARLADHAEAAGDAAAVLRFAPAAARHAASIGAHREAAAQYARALRFGDTLQPATRADLLEGRSYACYLTDQTEASIDALEQAIGFYRAAGDESLEGAALSQLSRRLWCGGRSADAARAGEQAVRLLEGGPAGRELALAYSNLAQMYLNDERQADTLLWSRRALDLADTLGDDDVRAHSLNNIGTIRLLNGQPAGLRDMELSLAAAQRAGLEEHIGRCFIHIGWAMNRTRAHELAPWVDRGVVVCKELGLEGWELYLVAYRARANLDRGHWDDAAADAEYVLRFARSLPLLRILALTVLGLVRARRGDPQPWAPLDEALGLLDGQNELQYRLPVVAARAEAAWLTGRTAEVAAATRDTLALAVDRGAAWAAGELAWLRHLAGVREAVPGVVEPYSAQLAGDGAAAAARWTQLGCPYDAALALVESAEVDGLRSALAGFQRLGARPAGAIVARRLRTRGVRGLPRGPRPQTSEHPARLTRREAEVLALVREGSSNAEIAARLYLSEKTVHHHVSAILRKLGVGSRGRAVSEAARRGLSRTDG
jgi:DNA-binding CsgD family transcriptional regulator